jgi:hypothetical protein
MFGRQPARSSASVASGFGALVVDRFAQVSELRWHVIALRAVSPVSRRWLSALDM